MITNILGKNSQTPSDVNAINKSLLFSKLDVISGSEITPTANNLQKSTNW